MFDACQCQAAARASPLRRSSSAASQRVSAPQPVFGHAAPRVPLGERRRVQPEELLSSFAPIRGYVERLNAGRARLPRSNEIDTSVLTRRACSRGFLATNEEYAVARVLESGALLPRTPGSRPRAAPSRFAIAEVRAAALSISRSRAPLGPDRPSDPGTRLIASAAAASPRRRQKEVHGGQCRENRREDAPAKTPIPGRTKIAGRTASKERSRRHQTSLR